MIAQQGQSRYSNPPERTPQRPEACLVPTLLERLRDDEPGRRTEAESTCLVSRSRMREIIKDALTTLFNTTNLENDIPSRHTEALSSVLNYGIPPLAGSYHSDMHWQEVERMLRRAILRFEPRIIPESLRILPPQAGEEQRTGNTLRFAIHAMVYMEPYPLPFTLMSDVDLETSSVEATLLKQ